MTADELRALTPGTRLDWIHGDPEIGRYNAIVKKHILQSVLIHVEFGEKYPASIRWSYITNKPVGQSRGYVGIVRLERKITPEKKFNLELKFNP